MDSLKVTSDNIRLDQVVFQYYGNLKNFDEVMAANTHMTSVTIPKGSTVNLPEQVTTHQEDDILW